MAGRLLARKFQDGWSIPKSAMSSFYGSRLGNREVVGFGFNGEPVYLDRVDFPMPAIRYKPNTPDVLALREKEKGDWKKLSIEEKKCLYRASFRQTFAELNAPTGEWKSILGCVLFVCSLGIWVFIIERKTLHLPLPESFSPESIQAQIDRRVKLDHNPIFGLASRYHP